MVFQVLKFYVIFWATFEILVNSWDLYREGLAHQWGFPERLSNRQGICY